MLMKKNLLIIVCIFCFVDLWSREINFPVSGLITVSPEPVMVKAQWEDSWFYEKSSFDYNHGIARIAAIFSEISYVDVEKKGDSNEIKRTYRLLGVKDSKMEFHYDLDYSQPVYGSNQVAFSIASKEISGVNGKKTLVFVVIRGTPFDANEWCSNLEIESINAENTFVHDGFAKCTEQVHGALIYYLLKNKIDPNETVFFITGHSRGGAISNLLGMRLADEGMFEVSNIFVYTFACPNVIQDKEKISEEKSGFIWNIINPEDAVPALPPRRKDWHFQKYGKRLAIVNRWNTDEKKYTETYLPKMNSYFNKFLGRDYYPFMSGSFIQSQITRVVTDNYKTLHDYNTSIWNFPDTAKKMINKIFPEDKKTAGIENNDFLLGVLTTITNGGIDYAINALTDMHTCETYLSWMLALDENELFSTVGSRQIVMDGYYECAVFDEQDNMLAQILDGTIQYDKIKAPIAVMPLIGRKVAIGFPVTENFRFVIQKESLIPTVISVVVEEYDVFGGLLETSEQQYLYPRIGTGAQFCVGKDFLEKSEIEVEKITGEELTGWIEKGELKRQEKFDVSPEICFDIDTQLWLGVHVGNRNIYCSFMTMQPLNNFGSIIELSPGVGHQNALFSNLMLDTEFYTRFIYVFANVDGRGWNFVPSLKLSVSFKPRNRFQVYASGIFDFNFKGFNDGPFASGVRRGTMKAIDIGDGFRIVPTLSFGARF